MKASPTSLSAFSFEHPNLELELLLLFHELMGTLYVPIQIMGELQSVDSGSPKTFREARQRYKMAITAFISAPSHSQSPLLLLRPSPSLSFKSKPFRSPLRPYAALRPAPLVADRSKRGRFVTAVADSEAAPPETTVIPVAVEVEVEEGGGDGSGGGEGSDGGGGGGGDDRGGDPEDGEGGSDKDKKKISGMSMSQKLTLGYAALVGVGGVMGYMKSGSQKSLAAGGISAALLYYVYTQLPARPAFASSLGLGISAALLAVMGSRFKKSGKIFPAGVVSLVSLVMVGGYFHGILRGQHA